MAMTLFDWLIVVPGGLALFGLLITDRWGHVIGTHNWRVSRRLDERDRERRRQCG